MSRIVFLSFVFCYTVNFPDAVTLGGAYDGGEASPVGVQGHAIGAVSGRLAAAAAAALAIHAEGRCCSIMCLVKAKFHYAS